MLKSMLRRKPPSLRSLVDSEYKEGDRTRKPDRYFALYETLLSDMRDQPISLLELGVNKGGSVRVWRKYFPNGTIVGLDLNSKPRDYPASCHFVQGSQDDPAALKEACKFGPFDVIIDDAAHIGRLAKASFDYLFDEHLRPGGLYVLEDFGTAMTRKNWPDYHPYELPIDDGDRLPSFDFGMIGHLKQLIDRLMRTPDIEGITIRRSIAAIHKSPKL